MHLSLRKGFPYIFFSILFIVGAFLLLFDNRTSSKESLPFPTPPENTAIEIAGRRIGPTVTINSVEIPVEIAQTDEQIKRGLSGRPSLASDHGMLFVFKNRAIYHFWMPDMNFPIDIIWIDDSRVAGITPDVSNDPDKSTILYPSPSPVQFVLEVNAGFAASHNIQEGDIVSFTNISNENP